MPNIFKPLFSSAEVGSFLKIDENQNEELEENHLCLTNPRSSLAEETQYVVTLPFFRSQSVVWLISVSQSACCLHY